eukprot:CAMPEP_0119374410 /NCGR_PEP_ID=MMETSP1334-20130426/30586_1 /TAXON_ID=127549 /ORGANISM="Calcidiscus leptoporus, Strain RCC1130" /LENGTH=108 /DNA_ID=CAMNT_0007392477 /DNA_START=391 /DNA_END=715 /DNA_ORIENTATION=-
MPRGLWLIEARTSQFLELDARPIALTLIGHVPQQPVLRGTAAREEARKQSKARHQPKSLPPKRLASCEAKGASAERNAAGGKPLARGDVGYEAPDDGEELTGGKRGEW